MYNWFTDSDSTIDNSDSDSYDSSTYDSNSATDNSNTYTSDTYDSDSITNYSSSYNSDTCEQNGGNAFLRLIKIKKSTNPSKKLMAIFEKHGRQKVVHFGANGMSDYTKHKDPHRKARYIQRHSKHENWNDPTTPGALSRWILWNKPSLRESIANFKKRFRL